MPPALHHAGYFDTAVSSRIIGIGIVSIGTDCYMGGYRNKLQTTLAHCVCWTRLGLSVARCVTHDLMISWSHVSGLRPVHPYVRPCSHCVRASVWRLPYVHTHLHLTHPVTTPFLSHSSQIYELDEELHIVGNNLKTIQVQLDQVSWS